MTDWNAVIGGDFRLPEGLSPWDAVAELEASRLAHGIALTLTRGEQDTAWLDSLRAEIDEDDAAHVLPGAGQLKARIGDVLRSALPYSA